MSKSLLTFLGQIGGCAAVYWTLDRFHHADFLYVVGGCAVWLVAWNKLQRYFSPKRCSDLLQKGEIKKALTLALERRYYDVLNYACTWERGVVRDVSFPFVHEALCQAIGELIALHRTITDKRNQYIKGFSQSDTVGHVEKSLIELFDLAQRCSLVRDRWHTMKPNFGPLKEKLQSLTERTARTLTELAHLTLGAGGGQIKAAEERIRSLNWQTTEMIQFEEQFLE
ncbi:MAG: hypothetical protein KA004_10290 [Verrucomicrobiales bacterium]|nr:hypothetical protein [Verrucomicrobiales bacterium]